MKRISEMTWKERTIENMKFLYGDNIEEFSKYSDDRRLYVNIYNAIMRALETMPEDPDIYVKVAMNHAISDDQNTLYNIAKKFDRW